jgi:hypothetical protein
MGRDWYPPNITTCITLQTDASDYAWGGHLRFADNTATATCFARGVFTENECTNWAF